MLMLLIHDTASIWCPVLRRLQERLPQRLRLRKLRGLISPSFTDSTALIFRPTTREATRLSSSDATLASKSTGPSSSALLPAPALPSAGLSQAGALAHSPKVEPTSDLSWVSFGVSSECSDSKRRAHGRTWVCSSNILFILVTVASASMLYAPLGALSSRLSGH